MPAGDHVGQHLKQYPNNYGIYLVDSFGNKELIYRDLEISSCRRCRCDRAPDSRSQRWPPPRPGSIPQTVWRILDSPRKPRSR